MKEPKYSSKMWAHTDGRVINIPYEENPLPEDHTAFFAQRPHLFGHTEDELKSVLGVEELEIAKNKIADHQGLHRYAESNGWSRVINSFDKEKGVRSITISRSHVRSENPEHFLKILKTLKPYYDEKIAAGEDVIVGIDAIRNPDKHLPPFLESRGLKHLKGSQMIAIGSPKTYNAILGLEGGQVRRAPEPEVTIPTQTEVQRALGQKPESMTQAEWNFYTRKESYSPKLKRFKNFLREEAENSLPATSWHEAVRQNTFGLPKYGHDLALDMLKDVYSAATKRVKDKSLYGQMAGHLYNHITYFGVPHDHPHLAELKEIIQREKENNP